ncbi:MAG: 2-oxoglutarate ferredoxin oxidoreductase subunit alpha, partial [Actinomycetota bacterium]
VGWGSTAGAITSAAERLNTQGVPTHTVHIAHLNPFPPNLGEVLGSYQHVFVPELNMGQLVRLLRAEFLVDAKSITKVKGSPYTASELVEAVREGI